MKIMLTGGAGYIGAHTAVALIEAGYEVCIVDNYSNSSEEVNRRVEEITGHKIRAYEVDCCDLTGLNFVVANERPDCIVHLAGYKVVSESIEKPVEYYRNNIDSTLTIIEAMKRNNINNLVFSSSAAVYGENNSVPNSEDMLRGRCKAPYGWTKNMIEQMLEDIVFADSSLSVVILRYFNPVGAHESGLIGEDPKGVPTNLMPLITQVAFGKRDKLTIFGNDYDTPDGTCRRDLIHVMDLAYGHVKAVEYANNNRGIEIFNLGTGEPYSVLELVNAYSRACGKPINYEFGERRIGDVPESYANPSKANAVLGWTAQRGIDEMCLDSWNWQKKNPEGYIATEIDGNDEDEEAYECRSDLF